MGFVGVSKAIYDFQPTGDGELEIKEGNTLFLLEKDAGDGWLKAKKKAADDEDDEPEGLVPSNYLQPAEPIAHARALYDYSLQTDEELSFPEEAALEVYDTSDADWTLVGLNGQFGFAPANYLEISTGSAPAKPPRPAVVTPPEPEDDYEEEQAEAPQTPAAHIAGIIQQKTGGARPSIPATQPVPAQFTPEASDEEEAPPMPRRPQVQTSPPSRSPEPPGIMASSPRVRSVSQATEGPMSPGSYHLYNIHEMISHMGKNKKMPTTLGVNVGRGIIMIAPEKSRDGPTNEWTAEKLTHYSIEGKHVFMELVRPSKSVDFHAGAKDTAEEIVAALGELAGVSRGGGGINEIIDAATGQSGQKRGKMLFDFMAQGEDEVTVGEGDELIVLDDTKSEEWWMVRRLKNGTEGVVPANYVQVTGVIEQREDPGVAMAREQARQNKRDEDARRAAERADAKEAQRREKDRRKSRQSSAPKSMPNMSKVRTWTDRSGTFKVEAEFIGLKDSKIHLHKVNGVQIAVPVNKMSVADLEYTERVTGASLDEDKPLSDIKKRQSTSQSNIPRSGVAVEQKKPKYDWFDFFLACGVAPQICERYSSSFDRDQMTEDNLQDIQPTLLRTLGLKEGDILRVMKHLDEKFGRQKKEDADGTPSESLFSGPDGALKNNTSRKSRPAAPVASNDTVDPRVFDQAGLRQEPRGSSLPSPAVATPPPSKPARPQQTGFDDDAWDVRPASRVAPAAAVSPPPQPIVAPAPVKPAPTGAMADLSLISPLIPASAPPPQPQSPPQPAPVAQPPPGMPPPGMQQPMMQQPQQQQGADHSFFDKVSQAVPRQRPQPPPQNQQSSFLPPPPGRAASAPQNQQQPFGAPPPLQSQLTGMPTGNYGQPQMNGFQSNNYGPPVAPPGQSMSEMQNQQRMQQMYMQNMQNQNMQMSMMPQATGYPQMGMQQGQMQPQQMNGGLYPQQTQQALANGQQTGSPFADPPRAPFQPQPTGFNPNGFQQSAYGQQQQSSFGQAPQSSFGQAPQQFSQPTGVNSMLPPALAPQKTGAGFGGFGPQPEGFAQAPLQMQPTGWPTQNQQQQQQQQPNQYNVPLPPMPSSTPTPAPLQPQKTGPAPPVKFGMANSLAPQPTGRANLSNATPQNPFGF